MSFHRPYPYKVRPLPYSGSNSKKRAIYEFDCQIARKLEKYINEKYESEEFGIYTFARIAKDTGISERDVDRLLDDGASRGITIGKTQHVS